MYAGFGLLSKSLVRPSEAQTTTEKHTNNPGRGYVANPYAKKEVQLGENIDEALEDFEVDEVVFEEDSDHGDSDD